MGLLLAPWILSERVSPSSSLSFSPSRFFTRRRTVQTARTMSKITTIALTVPAITPIWFEDLKFQRKWSETHWVRIINVYPLGDVGWSPIELVDKIPAEVEVKAGVLPAFS